MISHFLIVVAAANKELSSQVLSFMVCVVSHYTMVAIAQQAGMLIDYSLDKIEAELIFVSDWPRCISHVLVY